MMQGIAGRVVVWAGVVALLLVVPFDPGIAPVFALNACFAALWIAAAVLCRRAAAWR